MAAVAAPLAAPLKRKKTNKISQLAQQPAAPGPHDHAERDEPAGVLGAEQSSNSVGLAAWLPPADPHDEVPIGKKGPSTFGELLERELARDQSNLPPAQNVKGASRSTFLKRGSRRPTPFLTCASRSHVRLTIMRAVGSGSGAALVKTKTDRRTSLSESGGEGIRPRQPLAETSRNNQVPGVTGTSSHKKDGPVHTSTAPQKQLAANVWDDIPVGGAAHAGEPQRKEVVRSVARKLDIENMGAHPQAHMSQTATHPPAARTHQTATTDRRSTRKERDRLQQQLEPDEEAELLEFESLERKVVQSGADDSIYRGVLNQDPYANESEDESDGADEDLNDRDLEHLHHEQDDASSVDTASLNHYIYDESETWDHTVQESGAVHAEGAHQSEMCGSDDGEYGGAYEAPPRSSLVNKLFIKKQPQTRQTQPQRKGPPGRAKDTALGKLSSAAAEADAGMADPEGHDAKDSVLARKMGELDQEIREFRRQNELLDKLRRDVDVERLEVEQEKAGLAENLQDAEQRFERYKEAELKKMKRDRKDNDKQLQLAQAQVADLRGERDSMRQEMQVVQEDAARKEKKLKSELDRLKKKMEDTHLRNEELVRELKFSEEARVAMHDKEHLASLKERFHGKQDSRTLLPSVPLCLSPRSQDALAAQIASSAIETQFDPEMHTSSLLSGSQRGTVDDHQPASSGDLMTRVLDASISDNGHLDSRLYNDSMTASFQADRTGMITDETLEIDVAKMRKTPSSNSSTNAQLQQLQQQQTKGSPATIVSEKQHGDGKVERLFADGKKLLIFSNGTRKCVSHDK